MGEWTIQFYSVWIDMVNSYQLQIHCDYKRSDMRRTRVELYAFWILLREARVKQLISQKVLGGANGRSQITSMPLEPVRDSYGL